MASSLTAHLSSILRPGLFSDQSGISERPLLAKASSSLVLYPMLQLVKVSANVCRAKLWHRNRDSRHLGRYKNNGSHVCFAHNELSNSINAVIYAALDDDRSFEMLEQRLTEMDSPCVRMLQDIGV